MSNNIIAHGSQYLTCRAFFSLFIHLLLSEILILVFFVFFRVVVTPLFSVFFLFYLFYLYFFLFCPLLYCCHSFLDISSPFKTFISLVKITIKEESSILHSQVQVLILCVISVRASTWPPPSTGIAGRLKDIPWPFISVKNQLNS